MAYVDEKACRQMGVDPVKLLSIARRLERAGREAAEMGVTVFGHSGTGMLVVPAPTQLQDIHAHLVDLGTMQGDNWDGGDPDYVSLPDSD
tara:strand:+ start:868 stop:1137 length:270 start_codon:yes stop_codon:yes gene_type:complete